MMRRILVDFARQRPRADKNTEVQQLSLEDAMTVPMGNDPDLLALDEAFAKDDTTLKMGGDGAAR